MAVFLQWVKKNGCLPDSGSRLPLKRVRIILESGCLPGGVQLTHDSSCDLNRISLRDVERRC
ncbi:hypothetical protein HanIR_Chr17g0852431 [Helianthus annuus]|nr:hypothetical protein HanIR_Chr17g0852431 [Helianthus annuus]